MATWVAKINDKWYPVGQVARILKEKGQLPNDLNMKDLDMASILMKLGFEVQEA